MMDHVTLTKVPLQTLLTSQVTPEATASVWMNKTFCTNRVRLLVFCHKRWVVVMVTVKPTGVTRVSSTVSPNQPYKDTGSVTSRR